MKKLKDHEKSDERMEKLPRLTRLKLVAKVSSIKSFDLRTNDKRMEMIDGRFR